MKTAFHFFLSTYFICSFIYCLPASAGERTLIECWKFDEPAGTQLQKTKNDAGKAILKNASNATTDGEGHLVIKQSNKNIYRKIDISSELQSSENIELTFKLDSASFVSPPEEGASFGLSAFNEAGKKLFIVRLYEKDKHYKLQARISGEQTLELADFGETKDVLKNLTVRTVIDPNNHTFDIFWKLGDSKEKNKDLITFGKGGIAMVKVASTTKNASFGPKDYIKVDEISIAQISPEAHPSSVISIGSLSFVILD